MARPPRWLLLAAAGVVSLPLLGLLLIPLLGPSLVRDRVLPRIEEKLGRKIQVADVRVGFGKVELYDLILDGAGAPAPMAAPRTVVRFKLLPLFLGKVALTSVTLEKPRFDVVRGDAGDDNVSSILARLRAAKDKTAGDGGGGRRSGPDEVAIVGGSMLLADESLGELEVGSIDARVQREGAGSATLGGVELRLSAGPSGEAKKVSINFAVKQGALDGMPSIAVEGGGLKVWKGFAVSGIEGGITPDAAEHARAAIDLHGGYGGVDKVLWSAKGWAEPGARKGQLQLLAARFDLGQLAPILVDTPVIDPEHAQVDARLDLVYRGDDSDDKHLHDAVDFDGNFHLAGLDVFTPRLGPLPVRHLGFDAAAKGRLEPKARALHLDELKVDYRGVQLTLDLEAWKLGHGRIKTLPLPPVPGAPPAPVKVAAATGAAGAATGTPDPNNPANPNPGPGFLPAFRLNLRVAPVACQTVLNALPAELTPALQGFKLQGTFKTELHLSIDPDDLDAIELGSKIGIDGCTVVEAPPPVAAERLMESFAQAVEVERGSWMFFNVGPENPDWVPYESISPHLVNAIMTTEDSTFMTHKGFIGREFRSALKTNLEHGYFRLGASSITMQMVKNVLLSREKTLSRKLQEMFITWYLERKLSKERILEIYFNVIEFGPGIYGIGQAAHHYFGKSAKALRPREAAWFSSILPNPKRRYAHTCHGQLDLKWELYLNRILRKMHERGRLTDDEFTQAMDSRLTFSRPETLSEAQCLEMVKRLTAVQLGPLDPQAKSVISLEHTVQTEEDKADPDADPEDEAAEP